MAICKSFSPIINHQSKILILGSIPGVKSLEKQQYYAHPQNRFWKLISLLCNYNNLSDLEYDNKLNILLNNKLALWDVIKSCERKGSMDSDILNESPNNFDLLLKKYPNIEKICFNGNKAYNAFKKYFPEFLLNYNHFVLPSTSPANARFSIENLYDSWYNAINL